MNLLDIKRMIYTVEAQSYGGGHAHRSQTETTWNTPYLVMMLACDNLTVGLIILHIILDSVSPFYISMG